MQPEKKKRAQFSTRLGVIAATVGSAVGLGNIWRFPYEAGTHGGGAFLLCYVFFAFVVGVPLICAEFALGRGTRAGIFNAYKKISPRGKWHWMGYVAIVSSLMILSFYSVVAGWTMEYIYQSLSGGLTMASQAEYHDSFGRFIASGPRTVLWTVVFLLLNLVILRRGVSKGIEKFSNILTPALFVLLIAFAINSLTMSGAPEGLKFLFKPDFSKLTSSVVLGAMGQAFFSLSLGLGCMLTYASYFKQDVNLVRTSATIAGLDLLVALLAGIIIFPAVFTYGTSPAAGPTLVFEVLPAIFHQLPLGVVWSTLFFFLLFLASLTSTISMSEISIAYLTDQKQMRRSTATWISIGIGLVFGTLCALSFNELSDWTILGMTIFNFFDWVSSNVLLPAGGFVIAIFTGWYVDRKFMADELTNNGALTPGRVHVVMACIRYVCPAAIWLVFLKCIGVL